MQELIDIYDRFTIADNKAEKQELFNKAEEFLSALTSPSSDEYHIWGLLYYFLNTNDRAKDLSIAMDKFSAAIECSKENFLARLYLAHCFHDLKIYQKAIENYLLVNAEKLTEFNLWRYVKLLEQVGYCYHQIHQEEKALKYFEKMAVYYRDENNPELLIEPMEIYDCLSQKHPLVILLKEWSE